MEKIQHWFFCFAKNALMRAITKWTHAINQQLLTKIKILFLAWHLGHQSYFESRILFSSRTSVQSVHFAIKGNKIKQKLVTHPQTTDTSLSSSAVLLGNYIKFASKYNLRQILNSRKITLGRLRDALVNWENDSPRLGPRVWFCHTHTETAGAGALSHVSPMAIKPWHFKPLWRAEPWQDSCLAADTLQPSVQGYTTTCPSALLTAKSPRRSTQLHSSC